MLFVSWFEFKIISKQNATQQIAVIVYELLKRLELKSYIEKFDLLKHITIDAEQEFKEDIILMKLGL